MDFLKSKFEIILLAFFVILYSAMVIYGSVYGKNPITDFAIDNNKTFAGALLMALTGRALASRSNDNKNGANNVNTKTDDTTVVVDKPIV